jgi:predicted dehydrogenase
VRVGLVGYGDAGRGIHAPLLAAAGATVVAVQTRNPERVAAAARDLPDAAAVPDLDAVLGRRPDVVVLASPSGAHAEQALACVAAGVPVVVDKPLATDAALAAGVVRAAEAADVPLTVFQNRRWDAENLTLARLLAEGALGEVFRLERRWERWRPTPKDRWRENAPPEQGGGLLLNLGTHLVDAAVHLLGPVLDVHAEVAARTTRAEDDVFLSCRHESGVRSHLGALALAGAPGPRTRVLGTAGAYVVTSFEAEPTAFTDLADAGDSCGWLVRGDERRPVPRAPGEHADFYRAVATAVRGEGAWPVDPWDAVHVLAVLDAARVSAAQGRAVEVPRR